MFDYLHCLWFGLFKSSINKKKLILTVIVEILFYLIALPFDMISKFCGILSWLYQGLEGCFYTTFLITKEVTFENLHILSEKDLEILRQEMYKYLNNKED